MKCRLCGSENLTLFYTQGNSSKYRFYKCTNCSLVNLDISSLNTVQNQEKYAQIFLDPTDRRKNRGSYLTYKFIKRNIQIPGKYLDIGCGNGSLLFFARNDGWKVRGLELSDFLARNIKESIDIDVDVANFLEFKERGDYDLVSLRHVLEHLPDSVLAMQKINSLLNKNGKAVLEFPNIMGISFKLKRFFSNLKLYKKKYNPNYVPGHCNEFSKESFGYLANISGFDVLKWETYSSKPLLNSFYRISPIGMKARVLIQKKNNTIKVKMNLSSYLEHKNYTGDGFKSLITLEECRVAVLNYFDGVSPEKFNRIERHMLTDEVFILIKGKADLIIFENPSDNDGFTCTPMLIGELYNVKKAVWHQVIMSKDAKIVLFERADTSKDNSEYIFPSDEFLRPIRESIRDELKI